jgi:uncharacterized cupredoxin-like copper-binding protein
VRSAVFAAAILAGVGAALPIMQSGFGGPLSVQLVASEFRFDPREVTAAPGEIAFLVRNQGAIEHNFVLENSARKTVAEIPIIEPGQALEIQAALQAGTYTMYCSLPGHREAGMVATLKIRE